MDIFHLYNNMDKEGVILSFKGDITQDLLSSVYQIIESRLDNAEENLKRKKKFYHILVECLQNVYHHMDALRHEDEQPLPDAGRTAIFMIAHGPENRYRIITGNFILTENVNDLQLKLDKISKMTPEELRSYYLETLSTTELSEKGGAGLGIIDIARKSGQRVDYSFHKVSDKYSFFSLDVMIY